MKFRAKISSFDVYFATLSIPQGVSERKFHDKTNETTLKLSYFILSKIYFQSFQMSSDFSYFLVPLCADHEEKRPTPRGQGIQKCVMWTPQIVRLRKASGLFRFLSWFSFKIPFINLHLLSLTDKVPW